jgi:hypothetical protein
VTLQARVMVATDVGADELAAAFAETGLAADIRRAPTVRGVETITWAALIMLPLGSFLDVLAKDYAKQAAEPLKRLVRRIVEAARREPAAETAAAVADRPESRPLVLEDERTGLQVVLEADLPADAYRSLIELDLSTFRHGPVHYDRALMRWRSIADEVAGAAGAPQTG